jgi:hypothetical protein
MKKTLAAIALALPLTAQGLPCEHRYSAYVSPSTGCQLGTTQNDSVAQVNADSLFSLSDWQYSWKSDSAVTPPDPITSFLLNPDNR